MLSDWGAVSREGYGLDWQEQSANAQKSAFGEG
jgi:hypothetical protein